LRFKIKNKKYGIRRHAELCKTERFFLALYLNNAMTTLVII